VISLSFKNYIFVVIFFLFFLFLFSNFYPVANKGSTGFHEHTKTSALWPFKLITSFGDIKFDSGSLLFSISTSISSDSFNESNTYIISNNK